MSCYGRGWSPHGINMDHRNAFTVTKDINSFLTDCPFFNGGLCASDSHRIFFIIYVTFLVIFNGDLMLAVVIKTS